MARGKALVAKLRGQPEVRDAEALAAWIGRRKRYMKAGLSVREAGSLAGKEGGAELARMAGDLPEVRRKAKSVNEKRSRDSERGRKIAGGLSRKEYAARRKAARITNDDDPFAEDYGPNEPESKADKERKRFERSFERGADKSSRKVGAVVLEMGGLKATGGLKEEHAEIPNAYKRRDGLPGDEMAEQLAQQYPQLGIRSERDLIEFLKKKAAPARSRRAA